MFTDTPILTQYTLGTSREIHTEALLDINTTGISFMDEAMARNVDKVLKISFVQIFRMRRQQRIISEKTRPLTKAPRMVSESFKNKYETVEVQF